MSAEGPLPLAAALGVLGALTGYLVLQAPRDLCGRKVLMGATAGHRRDRARRGWFARPRARQAGIALTMVSTALMSFPPCGRAQPTSADVEFAFDIPSLPLEEAIAAFGAASGYQVLYETALTIGLWSHQVKGTYTADTALRRLLAGSNLRSDYIEDHAFTLMRAELPTARTIADFRDYLGVVQSSLMAALCQRGETRPGAYNVVMQFSIGRTGRIENPLLLNSSGVESRDNTLQAVLSRLIFDRGPPADMPQPVTMVLKSDGRGARECQEGRR